MELIMPEFIQTAPQRAIALPSGQRDKVAAVIKVVVRVADAWGLSNAAATLFGATLRLGAE